jgi:ribosomal protein S18 acetylase RimI-like enzyme
MITVRPYRDMDEAAVIGLARELQSFEEAIFDRIKPASSIGVWYIDYLKSQCAESEGEILVAVCEGSVAGYATILRKVKEDGKGDEVAHDYALVGDLAVASVFRRRGMASALLDACEKIAKAAGCDDFRVSVLAGNDGAHKLYRRAGFEDHLISMRKRLA